MLASSEAVNAFSSSSDNGGDIVEITRVLGLLSYTIILLPVGSEMACSVMTILIDRVIQTNSESMPKDMKALMQNDPKQLSFLDPESLPKLSHKQLCCDMGQTVMKKPAEHALGLIEFYEYLKSSLFIGPFDTIENPTLVPAIYTEQVVGCVGGNGDAEHVPLWFCCKEGLAQVWGVRPIFHVGPRDV